MREQHFETPSPVDLFVELGRGHLRVLATETAESAVTVSGRDAEAVRIEQNGDRISVTAPRRTGFFGDDAPLDITVTVPTGSNASLRTGSADIDTDGSLSTTQVRSGSGDVHLDTLDGPGAVETGSGSIRIDEACAELRIKSGSGDVTIGTTSTTAAVSTGSGDVEIGTSAGPTAVKTGSGDLTVVDATADVSLTTASGDFEVRSARRGRMTAKAASGDVRLGIPAGVPVWTDISTLTGAIRSSLHGVGEPADGGDHVEVRAKTVSGDVVLTEI